MIVASVVNASPLIEHLRRTGLYVSDADGHDGAIPLYHLTL
jgi:hypothetical protein